MSFNEIKLCECGCGERISNGNRFVNGHNLKVLQRSNSMKNDYKVNGDVVEIYLDRKNGERLAALIDKEDLELVKSFRNKWYSSKNKMGTFYVVGEICSGNRASGNFKRKVHLLHRWIMKPPEGMVVDHINHNPLDNRKQNLRIVTVGENNQNKNSCTVPGVYRYHHDKRKWVAYARNNDKRYYFGIFDNKKDAEEVVMRFKKKFHPYSKVAEKW